MKIHTFATPLLLGALALPGPARADSAGPTGRVRSLTIATPGSDAYASYRGAVEIGQKKRPPVTYYFGRAYCPGKDLSDAQVALLAEALEDAGKIRITPRFKNGQGGRKCLVGFTLRRGGGGKHDD